MPTGSVTRRRPALSPSRAADFKQCPLLYRFRAIDRLPEPASPAQLRDTAWEQLADTDADLVSELGAEQRDDLLAEARALLSGYYRLEDPRRFNPQGCEQRVEVGTPPPYPGWPADPDA